MDYNALLNAEYPDSVRAPSVPRGYDSSSPVYLDKRPTDSQTVADKAARGYSQLESQGKSGDSEVKKSVGAAGGTAGGKVSNLGALCLLLLSLSINLFRRFSSKSVTSLNKSKRKTRGQNGTQ